MNDQPAEGGAFAVLNEKKLDREGLKLLGGIRSLEALTAILERIKEGSKDLQERVFLGEIVKLIGEGLDSHNNLLNERAVKLRAVKLVDKPKGKAN